MAFSGSIALCPLMPFNYEKKNSKMLKSTGQEEYQLKKVVFLLGINKDILLVSSRGSLDYEFVKFL